MPKETRLTGPQRGIEGMIDRESGRNRTIATGRRRDRAVILADQRYCCSRLFIGGRLDLQLLQGPWTGGGAIDIHNNGFDIAVVDIFLLVREFLEFLERSIRFKFIQFEAQFGDPVTKCVPPAVLAEHKARTSEAGIHQHGMLQHAVLVDAGFMRECVLAHDCLVTRHLHASDA